MPQNLIIMNQKLIMTFQPSLVTTIDLIPNIF